MGAGHMCDDAPHVCPKSLGSLGSLGAAYLVDGRASPRPLSEPSDLGWRSAAALTWCRGPNSARCPSNNRSMPLAVGCTAARAHAHKAVPNRSRAAWCSAVTCAALVSRAFAGYLSPWRPIPGPAFDPFPAHYCAAPLPWRRTCTQALCAFARAARRRRAYPLAPCLPCLPGVPASQPAGRPPERRAVLCGPRLSYQTSLPPYVPLGADCTCTCVADVR